MTQDDPLDKIFLWAGLGTMTLFTLIGILLLAGAEVRTLSCQRSAQTQGNCEITSFRPVTRQQHTDALFPVNQLTQAKVESIRSSSGSGYLHRVVLVTEEFEVPMAAAYDSEQGEKAIMANRINAFIQDRSQPALSVQQNDCFFFYLMGGAFLLTGNTVGGIFVWLSLTILRPQKLKDS